MMEGKRGNDKGKKRAWGFERDLRVLGSGGKRNGEGLRGGQLREQ